MSIALLNSPDYFDYLILTELLDSLDPTTDCLEEDLDKEISKL